MSNEPSIADLKSAFAAQLATLPPPAPGRHDNYRPRTRSQAVVTVGAAFVGVVAVTTAAVALVGRDPGPANIVAQPPTLSTLDIAGTEVELPAGVRPGAPSDCVELMPKRDDLPGDTSGWGWGIVWGPATGEPPDCFQVQAANGTLSPPSQAEPTTVAGLDAWTWPVADDVQVYLVEIPVANGDQATTPLLVMVGGSATADVSWVVEGILDQL
ncbi:MAG: hypothetical protein IRY85_11600 [Micromonosporaceae bacterium]|nr:hypothetical protein [Micromonosporaceae bacterium]